jgi:hypothetical protein
MPRPKKACDLENGCRKVKRCDCGCEKCVNHCTKKHLTIDVSTPREFSRTSREQTKQKIQVSVHALEQSPSKICKSEVEEKSPLNANVGGLFEKIASILPFSSPALNQLPKSPTATILCSEPKYFQRFISVIIEIIVALCRSLVVRTSPKHYAPFVQKVEEALVERLQRELGLDNPKFDTQEHFTFLQEQLVLYNGLPSKSGAIKRYIKASLCHGYHEKQLEAIFGNSEPWGRTSRFEAKKDFLCLQQIGEFYDHQANQDNILVADYHQDAIEYAVGYIVDNCQMFAHGQKRVPLGDGTTELLPVLTRLKPANDMWVDYRSSFNNAMQSYTKIAAHQDVLYTDKYKGSIFNLLIEWVDEEATWEPMHAVVSSDAIAVAEYGRVQNMLETKGWVHLQKFISSTEEAKFLTLKGGRKFLGETSFKQLVRVLTSGDEKLVKSVDYVKGMLVHDNISVLQRIIDDHLDVGASKQRQVLSDELTILGNYLKVQYKQHHAPLDHCAGCDSHGVNYGLELPTEELNREPHYSTMAKGDLEKLVASRKIPAPSRAKSNVTHLSRMLDYDDWVGLEKISDEIIGEQLQIPKDQESFDLLLADIGKLTKKNMVTLASKYNISLNFRKKKDYHEALVAALNYTYDNQQGMCTCLPINIEQKHTSHAPIFDIPTTDATDASNNTSPTASSDTTSPIADGSATTQFSFEDQDEPPGLEDEEGEGGVTEDETPNPEGCDGCNYLHWFLLERLPRALYHVLAQLDDKNTDQAKSIVDALEFIQESHHKMMLFQAHMIRVVNQQKKLDEYRQELYDLCAEHKYTTVQQLYIVIDFKMKWESMYQREKTTDHFGKRGISWHGCRMEYFLWSEAKQKVEAHVLKLDQILSCANKQDAMTVLALIEALQIYCHVEFSEAEITYLQSDNASCYQAKQVVLGIPQLNNVSVGILYASSCDICDVL